MKWIEVTTTAQKKEMINLEKVCSIYTYEKDGKISVGFNLDNGKSVFTYASYENIKGYVSK